jgi:integrase
MPVPVGATRRGDPRRRGRYVEAPESGSSTPAEAGELVGPCLRAPALSRMESRPPKVVQEHLGHSSYAITADIYSHVAPVQQREAADKLGQAIHW